VHNITQHAPIMLALLAHAHTSSCRLDACFAGTSTTRGHHQHQLPDAVDTVFAEPARPRWRRADRPRGMPGAGPGPADRPRGTPWARESHARARIWAAARSRCSPLMVRGRCHAPQVRVDRVRVPVPAAMPMFRLQPAPPRPARGYRSKNGEDPSSWARERLCTVIGTRPVKACGGLNLGVVVGSLDYVG